MERKAYRTTQDSGPAAPKRGPGRPPGIRNGEGRTSAAYLRKKARLTPLQYDDKLSLREQRFVELMVKDPEGDPLQHVVDAGYPQAKAESYLRLLLRKGAVREALNNYQDAIRDELAVDSVRVLEEECRIAFCDIRRLFNGGPVPVAPRDLPDDVAAAVSSIQVVVRELWAGSGKGREQVGTETTYRYTFWDKGRALERLSKHLGLYAADNAQRPQVPLTPTVNLYLYGDSKAQVIMPQDLYRLPIPAPEDPRGPAGP